MACWAPRAISESPRAVDGDAGLAHLVFSNLVREALALFEEEGMFAPLIAMPPREEGRGPEGAVLVEAFLCDYTFQRLMFLKQVLHPRASVTPEDLVWSLCETELLSIEEKAAGRAPLRHLAAPVGEPFRFDALYREIAGESSGPSDMTEYPASTDLVDEPPVLPRTSAQPSSPLSPLPAKEVAALPAAPDPALESSTAMLSLFEDAALHKFVAAVTSEDPRFSYVPRLLERRVVPMAMAPSDDALSLLSEGCPNFEEVLMYARRQALLCRTGGVPFRLPPMLLLGPPGVGKTHFGRALSRALEVDFKLVPVNAMSAGFTMTGMHRTWQRATPGLVARTLLEGSHGNSVLLLDELEKAERVGPHGSPLDALYQLLEPETSTTFRDEFFDLPMDASRITWLATANTSDSLPEPLLSRFKTFNIRALTVSETMRVAETMLKEMLSAYRLTFEHKIDASCAGALHSVSPRDLRLALTDAVAFALSDGRTSLSGQDLAAASRKSQAKQALGFSPS